MTTKKSAELTLKDRLSRLNFTQACKVIGPGADGLIRDGGKFEIDDFDHQVFLDDEVFRLELSGATVSITLSDDRRRRLKWMCTQCDSACVHVGAAFSLVLEEKMLLPQYSMSRLVDRMEAAGYVQRATCPGDGRSQHVVITPAGRALQKKMWDVYGAAIDRHVGEKLTKKEAASLCDLLGKLR